MSNTILLHDLSKKTKENLLSQNIKVTDEHALAFTNALLDVMKNELLKSNTIKLVGFCNISLKFGGEKKRFFAKNSDTPDHYIEYVKKPRLIIKTSEKFRKFVQSLITTE